VPQANDAAAAKIAGVLLAAGASTRLGQPKQLVKHEGVTLLRRAAQAAIGAGLDPVVVVLGAQADRLVSEVGDLALQVVINENWRAGLGNSISAGVRALDGAPIGAPVESVLIMLADQPRVDAAVIGRLMHAFRAGSAPIVASAYGDALGVPALFGRAYLPCLAELSGDRGAKAIIAGAAAEVEAIPFPEGEHDVDTARDVQRLQERSDERSFTRFPLPRDGQ
jgi:molybdenum cofactor cytidylyltransferase